MRSRVLRALLFACAVIPAYADVVVAADGSGQFRTVQQAVDAAPANSHTRFVIHIRPGIYREPIVVPYDKPFLSFIGEDAKTTVLTGNLNANMPGLDGKPIGTFRTPSVSIVADDFIAGNLAFENSACFAIAGFSDGRTRCLHKVVASISKMTTSKARSILSSAGRPRSSGTATSR